MEREEISESEITALGLNEPKIVQQFVRQANGLIKNNVMDKATVLQHLADLVIAPYLYAEGWNKFKTLAEAVMEYQAMGKLPIASGSEFDLKNEVPAYSIFGKKNIEENAIRQMDAAMRLPVAVAGALMPDAHEGYGLPIGGVLATTADKIIPFAVGTDIACRMCMSIFDVPANILETQKEVLKKLLVEHTVFGTGGKTKTKFDSSIIDKPEWDEINVVRSLKDKAYQQLGTSGTGNHFVEWGQVEVYDMEDGLQIPAGKYLALLSHSGSRGFGGSVAGYYTRIAVSQSSLPQHIRKMAWLDLNSEEGFEYWIAMNLAGEYAAANHYEIHNKIAKAFGSWPALRIENHHNFAWLEKLADGTEVMVHRKGATPAGVNDLGIIPGSMTAPGYIVKGKGFAGSLGSASHGAGRSMSRTAAIKTITKSDTQNELKRHGVELVGGDLDEAPMAYKNINAVIESQKDLVDVLGIFKPGIVRMANPKERPED